MQMFDRIRKFLELELEKPEGNASAPASQNQSKEKAKTVVPEPDWSGALTEGKPKGKPLSATLTQAVISNRSQEYKSTTGASYRTAADRVKTLFAELDQREWVDANRIHGIVKDFLHLLKTDKNILLNLAYLPSTPEDYLYTHSVNVSLLSMALATGAGYSEDQVRDISAAALLIDVGMMRVPASILNKSGPLTEEDLFEIRKHPITGADLISTISGLSDSTILAIYQHHERNSGDGYPKQRPGHLIHEYSRIIAIADTYAAMVANRNHRKRHLPYDAMTALIKMGGLKQLDGELIRRFLETMSLFPLGSHVRLESGAVGKIIHSNPGNFTKPTMFILKPDAKGRLKPGTLLDLSSAPNEKIVEALDETAASLDPMLGF